MVKKKISKHQKISSKKLKDEYIFEEHNPLEYLVDSDNLVNAITECLKEKDFKGIAELIKIYHAAIKRYKSFQDYDGEYTQTRKRSAFSPDSRPSCMVLTPTKAKKIS